MVRKVVRGDGRGLGDAVITMSVILFFATGDLGRDARSLTADSDWDISNGRFRGVEPPTVDEILSDTGAAVFGTKVVKSLF